MRTHIAWLALLGCCCTWLCAAPLPGFALTDSFGEQARWTTLNDGVRIYVNTPATLDSKSKLPTEVIVYATPNGNSIEQTLGGKLAASQGLADWHFDIQHVAAQIRLLRSLQRDRNIVLVVAQAAEKSWPTYRRVHIDAPQRVRQMIADVCRDLPGSSIHLVLTAHSGGGQFLWSYIDGGEAIGDQVDRIAFLDANYSYSDESHHGDKFLAWLRGNHDRHLVVIAYDDRAITLNGVKVLKSPLNGTYGASHRMIDRFSKDEKFTTDRLGPFDCWTGMNGQIHFYIHPNPDNKILHTMLVGEMNGLLQALTVDTPQEHKWGSFGGPRAYMDWVGPIPTTRPVSTSLIPARPSDAPTGTAFAKSIASLPTLQREQAIEREVLRGNIPDFLRSFHTIRIQGKLADGKVHQLELQVAPDYLSVGSDADYVRMPLTPATAARIADRLSCSLPTCKMVDEIHRNATLKLQPAPLVENREAMATFMQHNEIIEIALRGHKPGDLLDGIKKDVVLTNRLKAAPTKVAIYGWEYLDGKPIQPLTTVHKGTYVDYSHGIRLVRQQLMVDGQPNSVAGVLRDPLLHPLLSDEGVMDVSTMYMATATTAPATAVSPK
jgi:hypothetical protein